MGCRSSTAALESTESPVAPTLLSPKHHKVVPAESLFASKFSIELDSIGTSNCFILTENDTILQVHNVEDGPIRQWNDYPDVPKVMKGDLVVKVRKMSAPQFEWIPGGAAKMLEALRADGCCRLKIERAVTPSSDAATSPVSEALIETAVGAEHAGEDTKPQGEDLDEDHAMDHSVDV
mmetsp:Transcript_16061/g.25660  ORF Transcript_16061/g.25660 Transcript_16061/m.25660 type:complete len:178 (+) Transcript_16061:62-595(+)